jgi:hypothetical protein
MAAIQARSPGGATAYRSMIMSIADAAAKASKEGSFLGIGGTLVSEAEPKARDAIEAALGQALLPRSPPCASRAA